MYGKPITAPPIEEKPFQFSLRDLVLVMLGLSFLFALLFQWGWIGFAVCWILACVGAMGYGAYWARWRWLGGGVVMLLVGAFLPSVPTARINTRRDACNNKLRQIGIALHNYHDTYGSFPPAYIADSSGRPMHGWRVLLLPYLEQQNLYAKYDFSEPWDGPNNRQLAGEMPYIFRCPSDPGSQRATNETSYLAVVGPETAWPGEKSVSLATIGDGPGNTLMVVESHGSGVPWMEPRDLHALQMPLAINPLHGHGICSCHGPNVKDGRGDGAQAVRADASVAQLPNDLPAEELRAMLTIDGGDKVP